MKAIFFSASLFFLNIFLFLVTLGKRKGEKKRTLRNRNETIAEALDETGSSALVAII